MRGVVAQATDAQARAAFAGLPRGTRVGLRLLREGRPTTEAEHEAARRRYEEEAQADGEARGRVAVSRKSLLSRRSSRKSHGLLARRSKRNINLQAGAKRSRVDESPPASFVHKRLERCGPIYQFGLF